MTKRRVTLAYHPCNMSRGLMYSAVPREVAPQSAQEGEDLARAAAVPNTHRGKYLLEKRLPNIVPQIISKPAPFKARFYQGTDEKVHEVFSKPQMSSRRKSRERGPQWRAVDS